MLRDTHLRDQLARLLREDLQSARFRSVTPAACLDSFMWVRITRMAEADGDPSQRDAGSVLAMERLTAGLYGLGCPWAYLLEGTPHAVHCWYGFRQRSTDTARVRALIAASYPDVRFELGAAPDFAHAARHSHCAVLTGVPSGPGEHAGPDGHQQLERICRGLYGSHWLYAVTAEPLPAAHANKAVEEAAVALRDARARFLLKASPIDEHDRLAQQYAELLEANLKAMEKGRLAGLWECQTRIFTDTGDTLARAQVLLHGAFAGPASMPQPLRICACDSAVSRDPALSPLNSGSVAVLTRPPREEYPGFEIIESVRFGVSSPVLGTGHGDTVEMGAILDRGAPTGSPLREIIPATRVGIELTRLGGFHADEEYLQRIGEAIHGQGYNVIIGDIKSNESGVVVVANGVEIKRPQDNPTV